MPRPSPALLLALTVGLAASLALWLGLHFLRGPDPSAAITDVPRAQDGSARPAPLPPTSDGSRSALSGPSREASASAHTEPAPADIARPAPPAVTLWGFVRERTTGLGLPACRVHLAGAGPCTTDATGRFHLGWERALDTASDLRIVHVESPDGAALFNGTVRVQAGMEILVEPPQLLRGRIVDAEGIPLRAQGITLYLEPDRLRESEWFLGSTSEVSEEGRFQLSVRTPSPVPGSVGASVGLGGALFDLRCAWAALASEAGATLVVDACRFRLATVDVDGEPLVGAELRLAAWIGDETEPSTRAYLSLETDRPLEVLLPRATTAVEVAAGIPGFGAQVEQRAGTPCGETWTLTLSRLGPDDVLAGHVLDVSGRPVADAFVSCNPATRDGEVGVAAHAGVRTGAEGRFELPFARGQPAELRAYHSDHGMTPDLEVVGGRRDLVLRFLAVQDVTVTVGFPPEAGLAQTGHVLEWVLALQQGQVVSGSERSSPFVLEELRPGDHHVFVVAGGGAFFASTTVSVFPGVDASVELDLQPARRALGRVLRADGTPAEGIQIRVADSAWPERLVTSWGTTTTHADGAFDLLVGSSERPVLALSHNGQELLRTTVDWGTPTEIRLP